MGTPPHRGRRAHRAAARATALAAFVCAATAVASPAYRYVVPVAAHKPGAAGTQWRTDLVLENGGARPAALTLRLLVPSGERSELVTLAPGSRRFADVLVSVFGYAPGSSAAGALVIESSLELHGISRTYNDTEAGTAGQAYPLLGATDGVTDTTAGALPLLRRDDTFRTNVGVVNLGDSGCTVSVDLLDPSGSPLGSPLRTTLGAGQWLQWFDVLAVFPQAGTAWARVTVETTGGRAWAYASIVDNRTGDPTTVGVEPLP